MPHPANARRALVDAITRFGPILAIGEVGAANVLAHLDLDAGYLTIALVGAHPEATLHGRRPISPALRAAPPTEQIAEARAYLHGEVAALVDLLARASAAPVPAPSPDLDFPALVEGLTAAGLPVITMGWEYDA